VRKVLRSALDITSSYNVRNSSISSFSSRISRSATPTASSLLIDLRLARELTVVDLTNLLGRGSSFSATPAAAAATPAAAASASATPATAASSVVPSSVLAASLSPSMIDLETCVLELFYFFFD